MKVIYISNLPNHPGQQKLEESLRRHGWPCHYIHTEFAGFSTKINTLAHYLRSSGDDYFIMQDAFDTYALQPPSAFPAQYIGTDQVVVSCEKMCWPDVWRAEHFTASSPWRYPNSGQVYGKASRFLELVQRYPVANDYDDQRWYTDRAIAGEVLLDEECNIFQSVGFEVDGDFDLSDGLRNNLTGTRPLFVHGNGRTPMDKFYQL